MKRGLLTSRHSPLLSPSKWQTLVSLSMGTLLWVLQHFEGCEWYIQLWMVCDSGKLFCKGRQRVVPLSLANLVS